MKENGTIQTESTPSGADGPSPPESGRSPAFGKKRGALIRRMIIMLVCVGVLFGAVFGYKIFIARLAQKAMSANKQPPVTVSVIEAEYQAWQPHFQAVGTTRALHGVDVTTEIAGLVESLHFRSGEEVEKGHVLLRLNADADAAMLKALRAEAELARRTFERDRQQFAIDAISQAALDVAAADLKNKEARVEQQEALVAKKTVRAPFDGKVGITFVNPGQYLNPGEKIVTLQAIRSILVDFFVPQKEVARFAVGQTVHAAIDTYPGRRFEGKITVMNPLVDSRTRNIQIEAAIENPGQELLPGMSTTVDVQTGPPRRYLTLPQTAVSFHPYGDTVYIIDSKGKAPDGRPMLLARQTFVTLGETRGDQVAVLKGIREGDRVVTAGQLKIKNGSPVVLNNRIQPSNEQAPDPSDT